MEAPVLKKALRCVTGILLAVVLFISSGVRIPGIDTQADSYFSLAIKKAGLAYATCRVVNGAVSVLKESSLKLEPAGIGLSLAVGQVLDPIDDMAERLSDVLVTAITSLGVQKLVHEISLTIIFPCLALILLIMSALVWVQGQMVEKARKMLIGVLLVMVAVRLCLPLSSILNTFVYTGFFDEKINTANHELSVGVETLDQFQEFTLPEIDGVLGTIENSAQFLKEKAMEINEIVGHLAKNMGQIVQTLLTLTFLYAGLFFIQVLLLPVLTFWFLIRLANVFFFPLKKEPDNAIAAY